MRDIFQVNLTKKNIKDFSVNGFIHLPNILSTKLIKDLRDRFEPLFDGNFTTGIYPDEWHWRKGISKETAFREIVNAWKSDNVVQRVVLSEKLGKLACELMNWEGCRIAQDDILWKPPQTKGVGYHRDSSYISKQFKPIKNNSVTFWLALDDADSQSGVVEYLSGSHEGYAFKDSSREFFSSDELSKYDKKNFIAPTLKAGDILCHHQDILHGSSDNDTKDRPRRAIGIHYVRSDVQWSDKQPVDYIYGRYKIKGEDTPRDDFFPLVYQRSKSKL